MNSRASVVLFILLSVGLISWSPMLPRHSITLGVAANLLQDPVPLRYITTFPVSNCTTFSPHVVSPSTDNRTVWLDAISLGSPIQAQIINFTINPVNGQPRCHPVTTLTNTIPQSIVYDRKSHRVWFTYNDTLAFVDATGGITKAFTYPSGGPQYIALDQQDNLWITLVGTSQIVEYMNSTSQSITRSTLPKSAVLQGIAVGPDGTVWFAELGAKKLGALVPCGMTSCPLQEIAPPVGVVLNALIQVAVDPDGVVWFTDHGSNQFGSFDPATRAWKLYPVGYCTSYCSNVLPNAIWYSNGKIWFSEHIAGRISSFDKTSGLLTEYIIPTTGDTPLSWWAAPGINNLIWFTSYALGEIGYVNASIPVSLSVSAGTSRISVRQGGSGTLQVTTQSQGSSAFSLGISPMTTDEPFFSASSAPLQLTPAQGSSTSTLTIVAAWNSTLGSRSLALTAFNGQIAVSTYVAAVVVDTPLPYVTLLFALAISVGGVATYLRRPRRQKLRTGRQPRK